MKKLSKKLLSVLLVIVMLIPTGVMVFTSNAESILNVLNTPYCAYSYNGHYYMFFDECIQWSQAKEFCEKIGGHLVSINSKGENDFILSILVKESLRTSYFIGASRSLTDHTDFYKWVTNEEITFTNFGDNEPNYLNGDECCLAILNSANNELSRGQWYDEADIPHISLTGFICEWESFEDFKPTIRIEAESANIISGNPYWRKTGSNASGGYCLDLGKDFNFDVNIESPGTYLISERACYNCRPFTVYVDGIAVGTYTPDFTRSGTNDGYYTQYAFAEVELSEGTHNIRVTGVNNGAPPIFDYFTLTNIDIQEDTGEQTITGKLTGSSTENKISIDGIWYYYDTTIDGLADAIGEFALNESITCKLQFGNIVACSKNEVKSTAVLSVNTVNNITYDATEKEYDYEKININLNLTNSIKSTQNGTVNTEYVAGYDVTFDKLVINVQDGDMLYFKDGLFDLGKTNELEIELDSPVTLKAGKVFYYTENIYAFINDDYKWGETETKKDAQIVAYAYNGDTLVAVDDQTVTFKNTTAEDTIKNQAETDKKAENAAKLLDNTTCVIQNEFLSEIFTKDELKAISNALQCKVALCALPESTYKKAGISEKIMNKLMSKAGINSDWFGTSYTADISLVVNAATEKYGLLEIEFKLPTTYYSFGSDNPFAGVSFDISYEITGGKGKKNVPEDKLSADTLGMLTYANIQNFVSSVQDVALDQLESAYNLGYGDDLNKVGEMLFGETMTKILSKTAAKSYSHLTFSVMTFPAKQVNIHCPVDVYVYDADGNLCASVENNEITMSCDDIEIEVVGDEKYLTIYEGEYSIEIIATANDTMDITIEEYSSTDEMIRTVAFNDVELIPGDSFKTDINENYLDNEYQIEKNDEDVIVADSNTDYIHFVDSVEIIDREANCTENGEYHIVCDKCGETVLTGTIPATGHNDSDHNGICDVCETDLTLSCSHLCHSENGFMQFIWKIAKFIYRIFGTNQYCDCGMAHW